MKILSIGFLLTILTGAGWFWFQCPCERIPGGPLSGPEKPERIGDWSFANQPGLCQLEVDRGIPWSVNLNCMSANGKLYLSCANCEGKGWSTAALSRPHARIKILKTIYNVSLQRVLDPGELDRAWQARAFKRSRKSPSARTDDWWSFRAQSI